MPAVDEIAVRPLPALGYHGATEYENMTREASNRCPRVAPTCQRKRGNLNPK
jgi:hypothetical protein